MKIMRLHLLPTFFCVMAVKCIADEPKQPFECPHEIPKVEIGRQRIVESARKQEALHLFSGQTAKIDFSVFCSEGITKEVMTMKADVFQKAQSLLAPFQKDIVVTEHFGTMGEPLPHVVTWEYQVTEVQRETNFVARFRFSIPNSDWTRPEVWHPAGEVALTVYPPDFAKEALTQIAKKPGLRVFGSGKLRKFLAAQRIEFSDVGEDLSSLPATPKDGGIYLGEAAFQELTEWFSAHSGWRGNLVVFCADSPLLPGVFVMAQNGFRTVKVTLPLLDTLSSDPRSQKTLLDIINAITVH